MKKKIQKIGSAVLCMALLGNAIAGSIPNGQVQAAQEYQEVYTDNFEDGKTYDAREGNMTSSNVVEVKTNHYLKYTVTGYASIKSAPVQVVGGRQYQLTYRVNVPVANGNVHYWPLYQEWNEGDNVWHDTTTSTPESCIIKTKTDGWVEHSMTFTPSTGMDHVHFFFEQAWAGYAEIWLDDIVIRDTETQEVVYSEDFSTTQSFGVQNQNDTLTQSWETEELHDYALKLEGASYGYSVKTSGIPVESGAEYKLTYKLRVSNVTGSIHFWPLCQEWKTDAAGTESAWTGMIPDKTPDNCKWTKATDGWIEQEMPITISDDLNNIQFFFEQAWPGSADVELDDITLTKVSDETVAFKQNFNTKTELTVHSSGSAGTQTFTEQGNHCLSLSGKGDVKTAPIRLENGKNYILSYRAKVENVNGNIYFRPIYQEWYNDGVSIDDEYAGGTSPETYAVQADTNGWVDIQVPFSFTGRRNMIQFFFEQPWDGTADIYIDDVKILEVPDTSRSVETTVSFKEIEADNSWRFDADNLSKMTAQYYVTTMKIDGEDRRVYVENDGTQLVVWPGFFQEEKLPTSQLEIPAGTVLNQIDVDADWAIVEGGEKVTITNTLKLVCIDNVWSAYDKETTSTRYVNLDTQKAGETISGTTQTTPGTYTENYIQTETNTKVGTAAATIDSANTPVTFTSWQPVTSETWNFAIDESISFSSSPQFYKLPATVDGESAYVVIEFIKGQKYGTIYAQTGWFALLGSHIPEKSMKFEAGAVMKQVDPNASCVEVEGGQVLQLTKDFELQFEKILVYRTSALYMTGDVHMDQEYSSMDLVAMKKVASNTSDMTTDLAALRAADVNGSDTVDATDLSALRGHIVGKFDIRYDSKINAAYNGVMPIIGYDAPDYDAASIDDKGREASGYEVNFITDEIYAMVKDMGFNTVVANRNEIGGADNIAYDTLKLTEKYGLKAYIWNAYVSDNSIEAHVTTKEELDTINQKYEKYDSFLGYYICDEPLKISDYKTAFDLLQNYTNLSGYMNLYPCNSGTLKWELDDNIFTGVMKESSYKGYLREANNYGADFLSYDMYLRDNNYNKVREAFYTNLKWSNDVAKETGKPFYAFVQVGTDFKENKNNSTAQSNLTTVQEMYLEANAALAMGAKGLNYYSLIQPIKFARYSKNKYDLYRCGLINIEGKPNHGENGNANYDYYNAAKKINTYVAKIDEVLMNAEHKAVIATEQKVKEYVDGVTSYASLTSVTSTGTTLVGCFDYYGREAYLVVNTSCDLDKSGNSQNVTLNFNTNASYSYVGMDCAEYQGSGTLNLSNLGSGEAVLVVMD